MSRQSSDLFLFHPGLDLWNRQNTALARAFSTEFAGNSRTAYLYYSFILQIAGDFIWEHAGPVCSWADLEVEDFRRFILRGRLGLKGAALNNVYLALTAFYTWLARGGHLPRRRATDIVQRLCDHDNDRPNNGLKPDGSRPATRTKNAA